ncbi:unnamed protein product [Notodromas monacha]|uniref:Mulet n=1 Tax=Notodromas monacha TaxID=399045 RepID=A0A7R9BXW6_9CRUS|nr:unnamed protein product [Notodromas monacha]CAG0922648.1 unnamed protein product [Notodromas monacha]
MVSLPEAIKRKYGDDGGEDGPQTEIFVPLKFSSVPRPASVLILNNCGIQVAGTDDELREACGGMQELDLADNLLSGWEEVARILRHTHRLTFLNLSFNNLGEFRDDAVKLPRLPYLTKLVLISVGADWRSVHRLVRCLGPERLEELHLSMNNLDNVLVDDIEEFKYVRNLYVSKNPLSSEGNILEIGTLFPNLRSLSMGDCPLTGLGDVAVLKERFRFLERLNIDNSCLPTWDELEKLRSLESLSDLRIMGCRAFEEYTAHERRQQMVARLDNVTRLNGSIISRSEREDAERAFVRLFLNKEPDELPARYLELVAIHGELNPLIDVDLSPRTEVTVSLECDETRVLKTISVYMTVYELKQVADSVFGVPPSRQKLFYVDKDMVGAHGPEEMRFGQKKLYSYNVQSGDEFIVQRKV